MTHHLQTDSQELGSALKPYARQSSMGYLYLFMGEWRNRHRVTDKRFLRRGQRAPSISEKQSRGVLMASAPLVVPLNDFLYFEIYLWLILLCFYGWNVRTYGVKNDWNFIGMPAVMPCFYRYSLFKEGNDTFLIVLLTIATMYCSLCYQRNVIYSITWGREFMIMMTTGVDKGGPRPPPNGRANRGTTGARSLKLML